MKTKTRKILLSLICMMALLAKSQSFSWPYVVPNIDWINYYSQRDAIGSAPGSIDANSNVYSTGFSGLTSASNLVALKYDSTGVLQYAFNYNNGAYDIGNTLKVDAAGNAYIAGISTGTVGGTLRDYIIIKLNSSGTSQWIKRYDRAVNNIDEAVDLCIDASGNVYVTGKSKNSSGNFDIVTLKLNGSNGNIIWTHIYSGSGLDDIGTGIVLSSNGSYVYITGNTTHSVTGSNIVTYALNTSNGTSYWLPVVNNGTSNGTDKSNAIILVNGNVVICGETTNSTTGVDFTIITYNGSTGSIIWQDTYDFMNSSNRATALARDSAGNIGVVGTALNGSVFEYHTALYSSAGIRYAVNIESTGVGISSTDPSICNDTIAHHWYVAGEKLKNTKDIFVYQIAPSGNTAWRKTIDSQNGDVDAATSVVVNGIGVVYAGGLSKNSTANYDYTTIKINQTPIYFPLDIGTPELHDTNFVFQENKGQLLHTNGASVSQSEIEFYNSGVSPSLYFKNTRISHLFRDRDTLPDSLVRVDMDMLGANQLAQIFRYGKIDALKHYFTQSISGIINVGSYTRLFVPNVYPNIDLHYYSNTNGLKSYYVCKTMEAVNTARFKISGATSTEINAGGYLIANTDLGSFNMGKLTAYQVSYNIASLTSTLIPITASWLSLGSDTYKFSVSGTTGNWPVVVYVSKPGATSTAPYSSIGNLQWSTLIGTSEDDRLLKCKTDAKDNFYTVGYSTTGLFPLTSGGLVSVLPNNAGFMGILSKFSNIGALIYSTYLGGTNGVNIAYDVAVDSSYQMYVVGKTTSNNMATYFTGASPTLNYATNTSTLSPIAPSFPENAFLYKINPSGSQLRMCSYFGGTNQESFSSIKYWNGQIHIGGYSSSSSIPILAANATAYTTNIGGGIYLHLDTSILVKHITKVQHPVTGLDMDNNGNTYLISSGSGTNVPIRRFSASTYTAANAGNLDWVLQRFGQNDSLTWSTYIGGILNDEANAICIKDTVLAIIGAGGPNFPIIKTLSDSGDVVPLSTANLQLMKIMTKTGQILWSVYHNGPIGSRTKGVGIDKKYNLYVSGTSDGVGAIRPITLTGYFQQNTNIGYDGYLLGYTNSNKRRWTTYFGSQSNLNSTHSDDYFFGMTISHSDRLFVCGYTNVINNSLPFVQWNNSCWFDPTADTLYGWQGFFGDEGLIAMFTIPNLSTVGIEEYKSVKNAGFVLYPNPNSGIFNVRLLKTPNERISVNVMNSMGQIVYFKENIQPDGDELNLDLGSLSKGVYLMTLKSKETNGTLKFIIEE